MDDKEQDRGEPAVGYQPESSVPPVGMVRAQEWPEAAIPDDPDRQATTSAAASNPLPSGQVIRDVRTSLANKLGGRHPVIIFGSRVSGKSTFLMSLVRSANSSEQVSLQPGRSILDSSHADFDAVNDATERFLQRDALAFRLGMKVPRTEFTKPFFIPVDVQRADSGNGASFAFLEGRGEFYEAGLGGDKARLYPDLPPEVKDILQNYTEGLTIIYVAPFCGNDPNEESQVNDTSLFGLMNAYLAHRDAKKHDFHLFLMTKWDVHARPMADAPQFSVVHSNTVDRIVKKLYPQAWARFCALPLGAKNRRFYMQYSSGFIRNDVVETPPQRHLATFDRYPQTVWNWLCRNAAASDTNASIGRRPLFKGIPAAGKSGLARLMFWR